MRTNSKLTIGGICLGVGAVAMFAPGIANGGARSTIGSGRAEAAIEKPFLASLTGAAEVPGPGDTDGTGAAAVTIDPVTGEICVDIRVGGIAAPTAAHIHRGAAGISGPVVVPLTAPNPTSAECVTATPVLAAEIAGNPAGFYVNVHNAEFANGAVRGQLVLSASTAGTTQLLNEPVRAYDSRETGGSLLAPASTRTISLATGVNSAGASVIAVPPGATGAIVRVTVTDTNGSGFLKVYSNALATPPQTSNVNWYEVGAISGADLTVSVDGQAQIKVTSGAASTHVVVDVVGYIF